MQRDERKASAPKAEPGKFIFRAIHTADFTILPNALLRNSALSFKARGIAAMLLSNREDWNVYASWIEGQGTEGREAVASGMRELEAAGYLVFLEGERGEGGRFTSGTWLVYDTPVQVSERTNKTQWTKVFENSVEPTPGNPCHGSPTPGKPGHGNPPPGNPTTKKYEGTEDHQPKGTLQNSKGAGGDLFQGEPTEPNFPAGSMMKSWNTFTTLQKLVNIVGKRAKSAAARYKELGGSMADWDAFVKRIEASDFLTGRAKTGREWCASFDWCIDPANFAKIREGKYDNKAKQPSSASYW